MLCFRRNSLGLIRKQHSLCEKMSLDENNAVTDRVNQDRTDWIFEHAH